MADIEKKIKLKVESNVSNINKSFNALAKHLDDMSRSVKKFSNMLNGQTFNKLGASIKNSLGPLKNFGKQISEMGKDVIKIEKLAKALERISENSKTLDKVTKESKVKTKDTYVNTHADELKRLSMVENIRDSIFSGSMLNIGETLSRKIYESRLPKATAGMTDSEIKSLAASNALKIKGFNLAVTTASMILKTFGNIIKDTAGVTLNLKENFNAIISEVGKIMSLQSGAATYLSGSTLISNQTAREQQMRYGLSNAQNWALTQTMGALGMRSEEDLMYMNANQRQKFTAFMDKYSSWYDQMQSSGVLENIQEMQLDLYMFKQELAMDFMNWFAENKDSLLNTIKILAKFTMKIVEGIMKIVEFVTTPISWIGNLFGGGTVSSSMSASSGYSDSTRYTYGGKTNNINITMTNNATGVLSSQDEMQAFYEEQIEKMSRELVTEID